MGNSTRMRLKTSAYPRIAARVFDTPLLIEQKKLDSILAVLGPRLGFEASAKMEASEFDLQYTDDGYFVSGSVAVIPVSGPLIHHYDFFSEVCGMSSYETISRQFNTALNDSRIKSILFAFDSPGGEVAGCFELADAIYAARGQKHIVAVMNSYCFSAAYALASSCDEIVIPRVGMCGSIGVVTAHVDQSKALEMQGIAVTWIYAGSKKVDGNSTEPLSESASEDLQSMVDDIYQLFTSTVARNRGLSVDDIVATEAGCYLGPKAVEVGLADRIGTYGDEIAALGLRQDEPPRPIPPQPQEEEFTMSKENTGGGADAAAIEATRLANEQDTARRVDAAKNEGHAAGATAAKERISAILGDEAAVGKTKLAQHLAFNTDLDAKAAIETLKASAAETATTAAPAAAAPVKSPLETAMERSGGGTQVGDQAPGDDGKGDNEAEKGSAAILAFVQKPATR